MKKSTIRKVSIMIPYCPYYSQGFLLKNLVKKSFFSNDCLAHCLHPFESGGGDLC